MYTTELVGPLNFLSVELLIHAPELISAIMISTGVIGFTSSQEITTEERGTVNLTIELKSGKLCGEVMVNFSTIDMGTTMCKAIHNLFSHK